MNRDFLDQRRARPIAGLGSDFLPSIVQDPSLDAAIAQNPFLDAGK